MLIGLTLAGCSPFGTSPSRGEPSRCEQDRYDCQERTDVPAVAGCELEGELTIEIGFGMSAFAPLADGEPPATYSGGGGFQAASASHVGAALRIGGAALDRYDVLGAQVSVYEAGVCVTMGEDSRMCDGVPWIADRSVLLGDGPELNVVGSVVEEYGITMPIESLGPGAYVVQALVLDPCGQMGVAHHDFTL